MLHPNESVNLVVRDVVNIIENGEADTIGEAFEMCDLQEDIHQARKYYDFDMDSLKAQIVRMVNDALCMSEEERSEAEQLLQGHMDSIATNLQRIGECIDDVQAELNAVSNNVTNFMTASGTRKKNKVNKIEDLIMNLYDFEMEDFDLWKNIPAWGTYVWE